MKTKKTKKEVKAKKEVTVKDLSKVNGGGARGGFAVGGRSQTFTDDGTTGLDG